MLHDWTEIEASTNQKLADNAKFLENRMQFNIFHHSIDATSASHSLEARILTRIVDSKALSASFSIPKSPSASLYVLNLENIAI